MNWSRRKLLRTSIGLSAIGISSSLAGCLQGETPLSSAEAVSTPELEAATYRQWLPSVDAVEAVGGYAARYTSVAGLRASTNLVETNDLTEWLVGQRLDRIEKRWDDFGLAPADIEDVVEIDGTADYASPSPRAYVVRGSYDPDEVGTTLTEGGFGRSETHRGFRVYRRSSPPRATGVRDDTIVHVRATKPRTFFEGIVDAKHGDVPRRHEIDENFAVMTEKIGRPTVGTVSRRSGTPKPNPDDLLFEGGLGNGEAWLVEDSTVYARYVLPFASEAEADPERVSEELADGETYDRVEVSSTGRVVLAEAETDLDS